MMIATTAALSMIENSTTTIGPRTRNFRRDADGRPVWQDTFEYGLVASLDGDEGRWIR